MTAGSRNCTTGPAPQKWEPWKDRASVKKTGPHKWVHVKSFRFPWLYCSRCRLLWLKNDVSNKAAKKPCGWEEDI
jgi:hypothetical protein